MTELQLTNNELEHLNLELLNFKRSRLKEIRKGIILIAISITIFCILLFFNDLSIATKLMAIPIFGIIFGIGWSIVWYFTPIKKFEVDIFNRKKIQDESRIKSYNKRFNTVKLENGFKLNDFEIQQKNWKVGDRIRYEYTPKDAYILRTEILNEQIKTHHNNGYKI